MTLKIANTVTTARKIDKAGRDRRDCEALPVA